MATILHPAQTLTRGVRRLLVFALWGGILVHNVNAKDPPSVDPSSPPPAQPTATPSPLPWADLTAKLSRGIVVIRPQNRDGETMGLGTGFVIDRAGLIATAYHVIGEARPIIVETRDGKSLTVREVFASDRHLDLAILRVEANDLPPLALSHEPRLPDGAPVMALGHPLGLEHSVVTGVVSAARDIDGRPMIQVAMPIEPGHSGGPLIDPVRGDVRGIMVMKSAGTDQLGFAVPIDQLQRIWESPNPVSITQWMTIGRLDPQRWTTLFGSDWRQRAGKIVANQAGDGFGGRTLCLANLPTPLPLPCELGVWLKLNDESGAAGLVFHCDGQNRHYGFYPSGGKVRLTCFGGPTVYSWDILADVPAPSYRAGEWNHLKVRLEAERIVGFVNEVRVVESTDVRFASGQMGLAKFRQTQVEFRDFQYGETIPPALPNQDQERAVTKMVQQLPPQVHQTSQDLAPLLANPHVSQVLEQEANRLRQQAKHLTQLSETLHTESICHQLSAWSAQPTDKRSLLAGALLISKLDNPSLDMAAYEAEVDKMAHTIRSNLSGDTTSEANRLEALNKFLFADRGYHGSRTEYYHPANSYLDRVIDDREGLPITLSILYMELGRRLELEIEGVGLPGHFIVRYRPKAQPPVLIDVFDRARRWTRDDAARTVAEFTGEPLQESHLEVVTSDQIIVRMLNNLLSISQQRDDRPAMARYLEALVTLVPDSTSFRGMRAVLRREVGRTQAAIDDLTWILEHPAPGVDPDKILQMRAGFQADLDALRTN